MAFFEKLPQTLRKKAPLLGAGLVIALLGGLLAFMYYRSNLLSENLHSSQTQVAKYKTSLLSTEQLYASVEAELKALKNEDQYLINKALQETVKKIETTYTMAVASYEKLLGLKEKTNKTEKLDKSFTEALTYLADTNYASAEAVLKDLNKNIAAEEAKIVSTFTIPANVATNNAPPGSGYSRQRVETPVGAYLVDIISADLGGARVVVDTASEGTCTNNCPVDSLGNYAARSGAFAGVNGPYFCPAEYPSCAGKTNSFDTLLMNKKKVYFNSDNNVYSSVPAVIFSGSSARYVTQSSQWGRDTGVDAVIASQPLLMLNGKRVFGGDGEPKRSGKGSRSFIGSTGSKVYIGVVHNVSTAEMAYVLETLGIHNALNLDSGGTTALWNQGRYLVGPGRNSPYGILLVR
jgi:hypothetical protein